MTKHKMTKTSEYKSWAQAKQRCFNPKCDAYPWYGGKGITMCKEWINDFEAFFSYIGKKPNGYQIDRIDNSKGYEPGNVRWVSKRENIANRTISRMIGDISLADYAKQNGLEYKTAYARLTKRPHLISGNADKRKVAHNRKLTDKQVIEIANSKLQTKQLQTIYGVSRTLIQGIRRGTMIPKEMQRESN